MRLCASRFERVERCHPSSLHSRWRTSPTRCWAQQPGAAERNVQTLSGPDSARGDKVSTWHDSSEACVQDVSSLYRVSACSSPHSPLHLHVGASRVTRYTRCRWKRVLSSTCQLFEETYPETYQKLTIPSVILSGTCRVLPDEFQGRRKFSNNACRPLCLFDARRFILHVRFRCA